MISAIAMVGKDYWYRGPRTYLRIRDDLNQHTRTGGGGGGASTPPGTLHDRKHLQRHRAICKSWIPGSWGAQVRG
jgi:hypothetical protein